MNRPLSDYDLLSMVLRTDLSAFTEKVFHTLVPGNTYYRNWHIDAITYQLSECLAGRNRRLIVTQPPRSLKSVTVSVAFVAWALGHDPSLKFACVSYASELAMLFHRQFRQIVKSTWYRAVFPEMRLKRDTDLECVTMSNGGRITLSVGGSVTGRGADIIIIDDPLKAQDAHSEKIRTSVNDWVDSTLITRQNDKRKGIIILVMQRLHEDDLAGKLLSDGGWEHLDLPAIALADQKIAVGPEQYHFRKEGDVLHAEREPLEILNELKAQIGSLVFSAQYQQSPVPAEGNIIKRDWFVRYSERPKHDSGRSIVQSWDCASATGDRNDYSVCTTWIMEQHEYVLLDVWRGRKDFPGLRNMVMELAERFEPDEVLIESAGPGQHLIDELTSSPFDFETPVIGITPEGSKIDRMVGQSGCIEAGQVQLPKDAPWLDVFLNEVLAFPNSRHDDQIDSMSQFLRWARTSEKNTVTSQEFRL